MRRSLLLAPVVALFLAASSSAQNDILYYKFDEAGGAKVINYASASGVAPAEGNLVSTNAQQFAAGLFGRGSLKGSEGGGLHNYVDTGWNGAFTGSFTVAWFMRQRTMLPDTLAYYLFGGYSASGTNFRGFTSGAAGNGFIVGAWGPTTNLTLTADIRTPAATRWVHVALVVDGSGLTATYYVDGIAQTPIPIAQQANVLAGTVNFFVGTHQRLTTSTWWDMDEFRFLNRAASAVEVLAWSASPSAADGVYGRGCGGRMSSTGGPPRLANAAYRLALNGAPNAAFVVAIGTNRLTLGPVRLPFDLGAVLPALAGCHWESSTNLIFGGVLDSGGNGAFPLPIPNDQALSGAAIYDQALFFGTPAQSSNAFAVSVGG